ncbi:signal peptide, CUB and EGF-like domain-containing protein 1 isoform X2 [Physella acuta]|uniref:signal peptide, CUB and EGF-like domain-containing protein 1 isoform X2 n=1 Tax=Physella acuta TaxID=109671 RepID=UPI0027DB337A|nr:signal peptide, CUB and EGF-like domain-containing protein 1 isoform X2 [Physella acuta]
MANNMPQCIIVATVLVATASQTSVRCTLGERLNQGKCVPCQPNTFNEQDAHQNVDCRPCTQANKNQHEIVKENCTRTKDSAIICKHGYFREERKDGYGECIRCTSCEAIKQFEVQKCEEYNDTTCCPQKNMNFKNGQCILYCGKGEFLNEASEQCQPCPKGSFMSEAQHTNIACRPCRDHYYYQFAHLTNPCNKTHPGQFECNQNYYKVPLNDDDFECSPCTVCFNHSDKPYQIEQCDRMTDTLCCPQPDMDAQKTRSGFQCHYPSEPKTNERVPDVKEDRNFKTDLGQKTVQIQEKPATGFRGSSSNCVHGVTKFLCLLFLFLNYYF